VQGWVLGNLMRIFAVCLGGADPDEYGDRVAETSDAELQRVRRIHQLRSYRIASVVRIGVVGLMVAAMIIGTERSEWTHQSLLIVVYAFIALCAVARAFSPIHHWVALGQLEPFAFNVIDVIALTVFQVLSTNGIYPLLIMDHVADPAGPRCLLAARGGSADLLHGGVCDCGVPRPRDDRDDRMV